MRPMQVKSSVASIRSSCDISSGAANPTVMLSPISAARFGIARTTRSVRSFARSVAVLIPAMMDGTSALCAKRAIASADWLHICGLIARSTRSKRSPSAAGPGCLSATNSGCLKRLRRGCLAALRDHFGASDHGEVDPAAKHIPFLECCGAVDLDAEIKLSSAKFGWL